MLLHGMVPRLLHLIHALVYVHPPEGAPEQSADADGHPGLWRRVSRSEREARGLLRPVPRRLDGDARQRRLVWVALPLREQILEVVL